MIFFLYNQLPKMILSYLTICLFVSGLVFAAGKNPFYVEIITPKLEIGSKNTIDIIFVVPPDHHLYRDMMVVNVISVEKKNALSKRKNDPYL